MLEKKKKTLLIVFCSIVLSLAILTLLMEYGIIAIIKDSQIGDFLNNETTFPGSSMITSSLNNTIDIVVKAITGIGWVRVFVLIGMLIAIKKGVTKYKYVIVSLAAISIFIGFGLISFSFLLAIIIISLLKSSDCDYEKPKLPDREEVKGKPWYICLITFLLIFVIFYCGVLSLLTSILKLSEIIANAKYGLVIYEFVLFGILSLIIFLMFRKEIIRDVGLFIRNIGTYMKITVPIYTIMTFVYFIVTIILVLIIKQQSFNEQSLQSMPRGALIILSCLFGPFVEEGVFRLLPSKFLKNKYLYVIFSSVMFGLIHVFSSSWSDVFNNPLQLLYFFSYWILGLGLSINYYKTKNFASNVLYHATWNMLVFFIK